MPVNAHVPLQVCVRASGRAVAVLFQPRWLFLTDTFGSVCQLSITPPAAAALPPQKLRRIAGLRAKTSALMNPSSVISSHLLMSPQPAQEESPDCIKQMDFAESGEWSCCFFQAGAAGRRRRPLCCFTICQFYDRHICCSEVSTCY